MRGDDEPATDESRFVEPLRGASIYRAVVLEREVECYLLETGELNRISSINPLTVLFTSACSSFASIAISFWIAGETAGDKVSANANATFDIAPILFGIAAGVALLAAGIMWRTGASDLSRIKKEHKQPARLTTPPSSAT